MADAVTIKIEGLEQLSSQISEFPDKLVRKGVRNALRAGGEVLREAISAGAPRSMDITHGHEPGFLADHIGMKVKTSVTNDTGSILVGPVKKAFYAMFAEFGTKHQAALPFIRPAFEGSGPSALDAFVDSLREAFQEALS